MSRQPEGWLTVATATQWDALGHASPSMVVSFVPTVCAAQLTPSLVVVRIELPPAAMQRELLGQAIASSTGTPEGNDCAVQVFPSLVPYTAPTDALPPTAMQVCDDVQATAWRGTVVVEATCHPVPGCVVVVVVAIAAVVVVDEAAVVDGLVVGEVRTLEVTAVVELASIDVVCPAGSDLPVRVTMPVTAPATTMTARIAHGHRFRGFVRAPGGGSPACHWLSWPRYSKTSASYGDFRQIAFLGGS